MTYKKDKAYSWAQINEFTKEIGKIARLMDLVSLVGLMDVIIKEITNKILNKGLDAFVGQMGDCMRVIGLMGSHMETVYTQRKMESSGKEYGETEKGLLWSNLKGDTLTSDFYNCGF